MPVAPEGPPSPVTPSLPQSVRRDAARWLVELQADDAGADTRERWHRWHDAHPHHQLAWRQIEGFRQCLGRLPSPLARAALSAAPPPRSPRRARRQALKTTAALLLFGAGTWLGTGGFNWRYWTADRRTAPGERARITLPDGSVVELHPASAIDIRFTARERVIVLREGDLLVATAPDRQDGRDGSQRPFLVHTRQGAVRALGTRFTVRAPPPRRWLDAGGDTGGPIRVAVLEGSVEIRPATPARGSDPTGTLPTEAAVVTTGQQTRFSSRRIEPPAPLAPADLAWLDGIIEARGTGLGDFINELRRHRRGNLGCDEDITALTVSGTFPVADSDQVLAVLEATLPIRVRRRSRYWVWLERDPARWPSPAAEPSR